MPLAQLASAWVFTLGVRFSVDPAPVIGQITRVVTALDPRAEVLNARPMREAIAEDRYGRRLTLWLLGIAGAIGLVLATIGLYGAVSYWVAQHARDLGVRATLGATDRDIIGLVIRDGAKAVVTALVPGLALGVLALRLTSSLVSFVVGPVPAPSVIVGGGIAILVAAITFVACYLPGRRAAKLDPLVVLRRA
jgi:predicted lysophospholipase L1 biosynthesis ABC-type transport system permease subunit